MPSAFGSLLPRCAWAAGLLGAACSAAAVEVGSLRLIRESGQPLRGEIAITDRTPVTASDLRVRIAARETFEVAGLRYHPALSKVQIHARQAQPGRVVLAVDGLPSDSPKLDLLLTVSDRASLTIAEFRIDTASGATEFPAARAGSSLAAQQRAAAGNAAAPVEAAKAPEPPKPGEPAKTASATAPAARPASGATPAAPVAAAASASPAPAAAAAASSPAATAADPRPALTAAVQAWAQAWSRRDVDAYIGSYAPGFVSADRTLTYEAWAEQRKQRILARQKIDVRVEDLRFEPKGKDWIVAFRQHYRGDGKRESSHKQLLMRQVASRWLIIGEREID